MGETDRRETTGVEGRRDRLIEASVFATSISPRYGSRWWKRPGVLATLALIFIPCLWLAWHYYDRVGRIPVAGDPFDVDAFLAERVASDQNAAELYLEAIRAARPLVAPDDDEEPAIEQTQKFAGLVFLDWEKPLADEDRFLHLSEPAFEMASRASLLPKAMFYDPAKTGPWDTGAELSELRELSNILRKRGELLAARGEPEAELEHLLTAIRIGRHCTQLGAYMQNTVGIVIETLGLHSLLEWAGDPGLSAELAVQAVEEFKSLHPEPASSADSVKVQYVWVRRMLDTEPAVIHRLLAQKKPQEFGRLRGLWSPLYGPFASWERERARRLLSLLTENHLRALELDAADRPMDVAPPSRPAVQWRWIPTPPRANFFLTDFDDAASLAHWLDDTPLLEAFAPWHQPEVQDRIEVRRRVTLLILALRAHHLEHGTYPTALTELQGRYFEELPTDPYSGKTFGYVRSTGQQILNYTMTMPAQPYQTQTGQWLVYSVGPDKIDQDGSVDWGFDWNKAADWLFPVPDVERGER